jgi:hypothetical protein
MNNTHSENEKNDVKLEAKIWRWLDEVIIKEELCPFARVPRANNKIKLLIVEETAHEQMLGILANECLFLASNPGTETTLIAFSQGLQDFYDYLDMLDIAQDMLAELDYEGTFQLASFHPQYLFSGEPADSVSHYTNRAPAPMFHIIREASITRALEFVDNPGAIPARNIEHAHALGLAFFKAYL